MKIHKLSTQGLFLTIATLAILGCGDDNIDENAYPPSYQTSVPVTYNGKTYETVVIGNQVWMAMNLNYAVDGSKCGGSDGYLKDENTTYCEQYGRLYNWSTAMALNDSCNSTACYSQIGIKHKGICPSGWHIPSYDEWETLLNSVGGSSIAGAKLKYGFSALLGGHGLLNGRFNDAGSKGIWWSASMYDYSRDAYYQSIDYGSQVAYLWASDKNNLYSVRCLQDNSSSDAGKGNDIANYGVVTIGTQTWMAENLDYAMDGSTCYDNKKSNCATYGRLYDWSTAMALDVSCNFNSCCSQINTPHKGICPTGWHIPSNEDWDKLIRYVDGTSGTNSPYYNHTANQYLKTTSGWGSDGNGTDDYGFSALPGGYGTSLFFYYARDCGAWWSASEDYSSLAYNRIMCDGGMTANDYKDNLYNVRCLQDYSSSSHPSSSSYLIVQGTPVTYDGETYETVVIGTQTWMSRNLNYNASGSLCYDNDGNNCNKYGRLYDWETAMALPDSCSYVTCTSQINAKHRGICPSGWHIPSNADWDKLYRFVDGTSGTGSPYGSPTAGRYLKAANGWYRCGNGGSCSYQCEDRYGFAALPGGFSYLDSPVGRFSFIDVGYQGYWWSISENNGNNVRNMFYNYEYGTWDHSPTSWYYSVRCLQDEGDKQ
jgi:uncharacterized protein (TIGR02145 family)